MRSDIYIVDYITDDYIDISNLLNKGNGILDWLKLYGDKNGYNMNRDNDIYKQYIIEKSDEFKKSIIDNLECKIVGDNNIRSSYDKFLETKTHIKNHVNIINNGVLIDNENKLYGQCDLLVRIGYIENIYPEIDIEITPININKYLFLSVL